MIDVMKRYKRVVQVGVQNRSGPNFQRARQFIHQLTAECGLADLAWASQHHHFLFQILSNPVV